MITLSIGATGEGGRQEALLVHDYHGGYQDLFVSQFDRVRLLVHQSQLETSARLGLFQYQQGFAHPLRIRFDDQAPAGIENALAYVAAGSTRDGQFVQEMVVNLGEMSKNANDFDQIFTHEMTHAVLDDACGGDASKTIPHWVQEGLAQFVSGEGDRRVAQAAGRVRKSQAHNLVVALDGPFSGYAYPQYYLAIQYMNDRHSINSVQAFVRDLIDGKSVSNAIVDEVGMPYDQFVHEVREFSLRKFTDKALPDY